MIGLPTKEQAIQSYYAAERLAGADPDLAYQRLEEFARWYDDRQRDFEILRQCMERGT